MPANEHPIGKVVRYAPDEHAALIHLSQGDLHTGDIIHIQGPHTELEERVRALQLERGPTEEAHAGDDVGLPVDMPVEEGDEVFRVEDPYLSETAGLLDTLFKDTER